MIKNKKKLFNSKKSFFRIPALIKTNTGRLIACADARLYSSNDNPNRIDKVIKISDDNGITWSKEIKIVKEYGDNKNASAAIDPQLTYDSVNDVIYLMYLHSPNGVGFFQTKEGTGYINQNKMLVDKNNNQYYIKNNNIYDISNNKIDLTVDDFGILSNKDNIYLDNNSLMEYKTCYLMVIKSYDNGDSWTKPICINPMVKDPKWDFIGACPGVGLMITCGKYKNRLLFPIYHSYQNKEGQRKVLTRMVYTDNGRDYKIGKAPKPPKVIDNDNQSDFLTESQIVEVASDHLMLFTRNHHPKRKIITYESFDGGETFTNGILRDDLPQPISQVSAINFKRNDKNIIALLNPSDEKDRKNGILRLSFDGGKTFQKELLLLKNKDDYFGYSSIYYLNDDTIGVFFEETPTFRNLTFLKVDLKKFLS